MALKRRNNIVISIALVIAILFVAFMMPLQASAAVGEALAVLTGGSGLFTGLTIVGAAALLVLACKHTSYELTNRMAFVNWLASKLSGNSVAALNDAAASPAADNTVTVPESVVSEVATIVNDAALPNLETGGYNVSFSVIGLPNTAVWYSGVPTDDALSDISAQMQYLTAYPSGWSYVWASNGTDITLTVQNAYTGTSSTTTLAPSGRLQTALNDLGLTSLSDKLGYLTEHVAPYVYRISTAQDNVYGSYMRVGTAFVSDSNTLIGYSLNIDYAGYGSAFGTGTILPYNTAHSRSIGGLRIGYPYTIAGSTYDTAFIPAPLVSSGDTVISVPLNLTETEAGTDVIVWSPTAVEEITQAVVEPQPSEPDDNHELRDFIVTGLSFLRSFPERLGDFFDKFAEWAGNLYESLAGVLSAFGIYYRTFFGALPAAFTVPLVSFVVLSLFVFVFRKIRGSD